MAALSWPSLLSGVLVRERDLPVVVGQGLDGDGVADLGGGTIWRGWCAGDGHDGDVGAGWALWALGASSSWCLVGVDWLSCCRVPVLGGRAMGTAVGGGVVGWLAGILPGDGLAISPGMA